MNLGNLENITSLSINKLIPKEDRIVIVMVDGPSEAQQVINSFELKGDMYSLPFYKHNLSDPTYVIRIKYKDQDDLVLEVMDRNVVLVDQVWEIVKGKDIEGNINRLIDDKDLQATLANNFFIEEFVLSEYIDKTKV